MSKILLTGGGSAGHVTPNIALIPALKNEGFEIHYAGTEEGIEKGMIERIPDITYHTISAGKLRRYFDMKNAADIGRILKGFLQAINLIRRVKPDIIFSKGGFVSTPVVWAGALCKIPVVIHESDITPGLANKLSLPFAGKICYSFPETKEHVDGAKGIYTGIPIRRELLMGDSKKGREICGFADRVFKSSNEIAEKPVILVIGGSLGSKFLNDSIREQLDNLLKDFYICHLCGKGGVNETFSHVKGYKQFEFVNEEMPHLYAMSDLIVSRAGATAIFEILSLKKPNILIPLSKKASRGDQIINAESFEKQGYSYVIQEEALEEGQKNIKDVIYEVHQKRSVYKQNMDLNRQGDSVELIVNLLKKVMMGK